jgi:hypothetical protein
VERQLDGASPSSSGDKYVPLPGIEWVILGGGLGEKLVDIELSGF